MLPSRTKIEQFLDKISFGPYVVNSNDCDVMAQKARDAMDMAHPDWGHGMKIMFGYFIPQTLIVGHGICRIKCLEGDLYYDCTTESGDDHSRYRDTGWLKGWWHYAKGGYILFWWYTIWGDYEPARASRMFRKFRKMNPWWLYGSFFKKIRKFPVAH